MPSPITDLVCAPKKLARLTMVTALAAMLTACGEVNMPRLDKSDLSWDGLRGQWVLINYWAEWCKPCLQEMPELSRFDREHDDVTVLGVNYDEADTIQQRRLRQKFSVTFDLLLSDPSQQLAVERPQVLPATLIFSPDGTYKETLIGPQTAETLQISLNKWSQ